MSVGRPHLQKRNSSPRQIACKPYYSCARLETFFPVVKKKVGYLYLAQQNKQLSGDRGESICAHKKEDCAGSKIVFALLAVLTVSIGVTGQEQPATTVKHVPLKSVSPTSSKDMFANYCASCHGAEGKGNGPAAAALRTLPANLTVLSQKNGGNYPAIEDHLDTSR